MDENTGVNTPVAEEIQEVQTEAVAKAEAEQTLETEKKTDEENPEEKIPWDELIKDPDYNKAMQAVVQKAVRSKNSRLDAANARIAELERELQASSSKPEEKGETLEQEKSEEALASHCGEETIPQSASFTQGSQDAALREHFHSLQEQASKLKEAYPDFDLSKELENPDFLRMTGPEMKIPLEVAYYALHKDDLQNRAMEIAAKATEEKLASAMLSNQGRPQENGSRGQGASINRFDYASMSKAEKKKFLDYAAAAYQRGEKVYLK